MFKYSFYTIIALIACIIFIACSGGRNTDMSCFMMNTDSVVVDTAVTLDNANAAPQCRICITMKYLKGGKHAKTINDTLIRNGILTPDYLSLTDESISPAQAVDSFVKRFLEDYRNEYGKMYQSDKEHAQAYSYIYEIKTDMQCNRENTLTYIASVRMKSGDTQGTRQTIAMNFNTKTGRMIRLDDIFVPGHEEKLKEAVTRRMLDDNDAENMDELNDATIFAGIDVYVPDNFIINKNSLTFVYCENEVATRERGEIRVTVPLSDLKKIMKKEYE